MHLLARILTLFALTLSAVAPADAQSWPTRPIKIIVSLAAGGTPDIICRIISSQLSISLGQQVVVENRPGGANVVGAVAAARAPADGYTLFFATAAALVSNPHTFKSLPYDPLKDFIAVSMVAKNRFLILAHPSEPATTLPELIAYDKANPAKLAFATDGPRNFSGILATWLNKVGGANLLQVPYATMPQGIHGHSGRTHSAHDPGDSVGGALHREWRAQTARHQLGQTLAAIRTGPLDFRILSWRRTHRLVRDCGASKHARRHYYEVEP